MSSAGSYSPPLNPSTLAELFDSAASFVGRGKLPSLQLAIGRGGAVVLRRAFGSARSGELEHQADDTTLYNAFSATKAIVASAVWLLRQDGKLDYAEPVAAAVPEFATNGKEAVRIEHLLTHTAGFPMAPFSPLDWTDREKRLERFRKWRLDWEPGSRFVYHPTATFWVLAEVIERRAGQDFRRFVRERILTPLGLDDLHLGLAPELNARVADIAYVGDPTDPERLRETGIRAMVMDDEKYFLAYNRPEVRAVGGPGSGAVTSASSLALFYQGLLHDLQAKEGEHRVWRPATLEKALEVATGDLIDPMTRRRAHRGLGVAIAGDPERVYRGFGSANSASAFGHAGAGGQIAWADPETGLSFVALTDGFDRDVIRLGMRGVVLSSLAASCVARIPKGWR
jgi:CubicO group peptidase (beta-lactamase class C family)